jgi:biotin operon repressor
VHAALKLAIKQKLFAKDETVRKGAEKLLAAFESERTTYGRQLRMLTLMKDGASIETMQRKLRCSRRTIFRYLNHLEEAGVEVSLEGQLYRVSSSLVRSLLK